ncbi:hypothetical protein ABK046_26285 [Streptomyces caeruleatus]
MGEAYALFGVPTSYDRSNPGGVELPAGPADMLGRLLDGPVPGGSSGGGVTDVAQCSRARRVADPGQVGGSEGGRGAAGGPCDRS